MAKDKTALTVLVVFVLILAFATPSLFRGFEQWMSRLGLGEPTIEAENGEPDVDELSSYTSLGVTIHYTDGSTREFNPSPLMIFPLTILAPGIVDYLDVTVYCTIYMTGTVTSWNLDGYLKAEVKKDSSTTVNTFPIDYFPTERTSGTTWTTGETKTLILRDYSAISIQDMLTDGAWPEGDYYLKLYSQLTYLTMTFSDGYVDTPSTAYLPKYTVNWDFYYSASGIDSTSLSIIEEPIT